MEISSLALSIFFLFAQSQRRTSVHRCYECLLCSFSTHTATPDIRLVQRWGWHCQDHLTESSTAWPLTPAQPVTLSTPLVALPSHYASTLSAVGEGFHILIRLNCKQSNTLAVSFLNKRSTEVFRYYFEANNYLHRLNWKWKWTVHTCNIQNIYFCFLPGKNSEEHRKNALLKVCMAISIASCQME